MSNGLSIAVIICILNHGNRIIRSYYSTRINVPRIIQNIPIEFSRVSPSSYDCDYNIAL